MKKQVGIFCACDLEFDENLIVLAGDDSDASGC